MSEEKQRHTPTPWERFDDDSLEVVGPDGHTVCNVYQCGGIREIDEADTNTDLILRAVNTHDALLDACRQFVHWYTEDSTEEKRDNAYDAAVKAIALAEEGS